MQTITAAESGAGVHHFKCWKRLEQQNPQNDRLTKKGRSLPQAMQASTKEVSNLLTSPGLHLILELVFSIGIKNQNFREEIPK